MLRLLTTFVLASCCAFAQLSAVTLYTPSLESQPAGVLTAARQEVSALLAPLDVEVNWRTSIRAEGEPARLVILNMSGVCSFSNYVPARHPEKDAGGALASTAVTNGKVLPFVNVDCSKIRDRVASTVIGWDPAQRDAALGRALARVLAHEIFHVLSGDTKHAREGLAARCVTTRDLLADRFTLHPESLAQMRTPRREPIPVFEEESATEANGR